LGVDIITNNFFELMEFFRHFSFDAVTGMDARGFVLGPPIALALKKKFVVIRKAAKMPNCVTAAAVAEIATSASTGKGQGCAYRGTRNVVRQI